MNRIDLHVHFLISKVAPPDWQDLAFLVESARNDGLDILGVAEHRDALHYQTLIDGLFSELRLGGTLIAPGVLRLENGLILSSAAEVALAGGGDVGVHAAPERLLALKSEKGAYTIGELLAALGEDTGTTVVAHHYFWNNKSFAGLDYVADRLDAVELPAKDLAKADKYRELALVLDLPLVGSSDAHTWVQVGSCRSEVGVDVAHQFSHELLKYLVRQRRLSAVPMEQAAERIRISHLLRDQLEQRLTMTA